MNFIHATIDIYEDFCEKVIVPVVKTGSSMVLENEYINPLVKLRSEFIFSKFKPNNRRK